MPAFPIQSPYLQREGAENVEDGSGVAFDLDLDLSDEDAQELWQEFQKLDPGAVTRDLADPTLELQRLN